LDNWPVPFGREKPTAFILHERPRHNRRIRVGRLRKLERLPDIFAIDNAVLKHGPESLVLERLLRRGSVRSMLRVGNGKRIN
jgi:hypothetical protein